MQNEYTRRCQWLTAIGLFAFFAFLYLKLVVFSVQIVADVELLGVNQSNFMVYWADKENGFNKYGAEKRLIRKGRKEYTLNIYTGFFSSEYLRIDPIDTDTDVIIHDLTIRQFIYDPIHFESKEQWSALKPLDGFVVVDDNDGYHLRSEGYDPKLTTYLDFQFSGKHKIFRIIKELVFIAALCLFFAFFILPRVRNNNFVFVLGLMAFVLVVTMAQVSKINGHPDEHVHTSGLNYYANHLLPPDMQDPAIVDTFSIYGVSRLSSYEMYYPLAGYFSRVLTFFEIDGFYPGRLFNVLLFLALVIFAWMSRPARYFVLPILLSAQAWYLFSYAGSDALALFVCVMLAYQVAYEGSSFNQYLQEDKRPAIWKLAGLALLFGSVLLLKQNYYFFALFMGLYILWKFFSGGYYNKVLFWKRIVIVAMLALVPFAARYGVDVAVNGTDRAVMLEDLREQHARPAYKPSQPLEGSAWNLYFKEKGIAWWEMHTIHRWFEQSFRSSFGVYGYLQYPAPEVFYDWLRWSALALFLLLLISVLFSLSVSHILLLVLGLSVSLGLVGMSFYESWTLAFQPQGRYFAPILPILGVLLYQFRRAYFRPWVMGLSIWMSMMAFYSFIFYGLSNF